MREAKAQGAEAVIHCGDVIGTQTLRAALAAGLPMHVIHGNNLGDPQCRSRAGRARAAGSSSTTAPTRGSSSAGGGSSSSTTRSTATPSPAPATGISSAAGTRTPPSVEQVANVKSGRTWLVNPGTVAGLAAPATWALGDLAAMRFELRELGR